jgi:hypothetical protein
LQPANFGEAFAGGDAPSLLDPDPAASASDALHANAVAKNKDVIAFMELSSEDLRDGGLVFGHFECCHIRLELCLFKANGVGTFSANPFVTYRDYLQIVLSFEF